MKNLKTNRIFQIIYPLLIYYILYHLIFALCKPFFAGQLGELFCLMIAAILTTIPLLFLVNKLPILLPQKAFDKKECIVEIVYIIIIILVGLCINYIATKYASSFIEKDMAYLQAKEQIYQGNLLVKLMANALFIPFLEELLYRRIICGQLEVMYGRKLAIFLSAIIFGMMHFNLVQFIYAFVEGLLLGGVYTKTHRLWVVVLAHGLLNATVVLLTMNI